MATAATHALLDDSLTRVQRAIAAGELLHPLGGQANSVDMIRAIAHACGGASPDHEPTDGELALRGVIGCPDHLVFILVDGMGMPLVERLGDAAFFKRHLACELRSIYPSATACAVITLATGNWPTHHGITGWWTFLAERNLMTTALPFVERDSGIPLTGVGCPSDALFKTDVWYGRATHHVGLLLSHGLVDGAFARHQIGPSQRWGFKHITHCMERIARRVLHATRPTYTYAYIADVDSMEHRLGPDDPQVDEIALRISRAVERLADQLQGKARIVVSADHGQIGVSDDNKLGPEPGDPLLDHLRVQPSGDARTPVFHVKPDSEDAFVEHFHREYGHAFALLPTDATEAQQLYGPDQLSPIMRNRLGDFQGVAIEPAVFNHWSAAGRHMRSHRGFHSGMDPDEMRVPLIVA